MFGIPKRICDFASSGLYIHILYILFEKMIIYMYIIIFSKQLIRQAFGPSACRDHFWIILGSKGLIFNCSWGALQPRNFTLLNSRSPFADPLAIKGSIFDGFGIASFASIFRLIFDRSWTNSGTILVQFFDSFSTLELA